MRATWQWAAVHQAIESSKRNSNKYKAAGKIAELN
jgi:hypothetical protein